MPPRNEQGGELIVVGNDKVKIPLRDYPHRVEVFFKRKIVPPCNPKHPHRDELKWDIHRNHRGHHATFTLNIHWKVDEVREIVWLVYY